MVCRACGSSPAVGSSTKTSSGRPTTAIARPRRCCWPPESRRYGVRPHGTEPEPLAEGVDVERVGVQGGDVPQHLHRVHPAPRAALLEHHADAGEQLPPLR